MKRSVEVRMRNYWGRRASTGLFLKLNCSEATMQTFQDMISRRDDNILKAIAGLEGGVVSSGSTCGVVSSGALALALMYDDVLSEKGIEAEVAVLSLVAEYVKWFNEIYGTVVCRERSGVDLWTTRGVMRLMLPGDRIIRCVSHISGAMKFLYDHHELDLPDIDISQEHLQGELKHCARAVLDGVRATTNVHDPVLERISVSLDGGVGLQGQACGALSGAIMAMNMQVGMNLRDASLMRATRAFITGHRNLRTNASEESGEPFAVGKRIVTRFKEKAGSLECTEITGRAFTGWSSFQEYMRSSDTCRELIELSIREATRAIERNRMKKGETTAV
jgi:C_GCAxxG_C_C family probable redox protein